MPAIRWYYARKNCVTCQKAQAYLDAHDITPKETVNGLKVKFTPDEALALAATVKWVWATTRGGGRSVVTLPTATAEREDLLKALIGPSGNLRAPALLVGQKLIVGFTPDLYAEVLG